MASRNTKQQQPARRQEPEPKRNMSRPPPQSGSRAVAVKSEPGLPAWAGEYESTGAGVPTDQKDFLIPMAKVLDAKSPEVEKRGANYVPGAEAGDIYIKNAPVPLIKGDQGFLFQPCYRDSAVIEWLPRNKGGGGGAGFVARHDEDFIEANKGGDAIQRPHPEDSSKKIWVRKSTGNSLVETRYYGGYAILENDPPLPLVLPFASTGHTVAKQWNMLMANKRWNGKQADIWLVYYRVMTNLRTRRDQSWYLFDISDAGDEHEGLPTTFWAPTREDAERGKLLFESLAKGERKFDQGDGPADEGDSADNGRM